MARSLHILVVEDNLQLQNLVREMLPAIGHQARCASTGEEAVEILKTESFDLLLADIDLPGMSGIDLARLAHRDAPDMKIVFASGFGYLVADNIDFEFLLLNKPYNLAQLKHTIEDIFSRPLG